MLLVWEGAAHTPAAERGCREREQTADREANRDMERNGAGEVCTLVAIRFICGYTRAGGARANACHKHTDTLRT